jgi:predicted ATPase
MHTQLYIFGPFHLHPCQRQLRSVAHESNPLFATVLINFRIANGSLRAKNLEGTHSASAGHVILETRDTLRQFIQQLVDQLPPAEQEIVGAASVAGIEFCVSSVAAALNRSGPDVETRCARMAQAGRFFATCGRADGPDGADCQRYRFLHRLVREAVYQGLPAGRRALWHLRLAERLERDVAGRNEHVAAELAQHFRLGRDTRRAIHYFKLAAQQCLERRAAPDAVLHIQRGLELLHRIPELKERKRLVLELRGQYRKAHELLMENHLPGIACRGKRDSPYYAIYFLEQWKLRV